MLFKIKILITSLFLGSDAEPVWKLQDPGFDQGYGSERSPEDDYVPPIAPAISLETYEAELRLIYPFINDGKDLPLRTKIYW